MTYRRKVDANHASVRDTLRACGWTVWDLSAAGKGCPDLLAAKHGRLLMIEVKDGAKAPSARKLQPAQVKLHEAFAREGCPVLIITHADQVLAL